MPPRQQPKEIDYDALAAQVRQQASSPASEEIDYDALAAKARQVTKAESPSMLSRISEGFQRNFHPIDALTGIVGGVANAVAHPVDTAVGIGKGLVNESERLNTLASVGNEGKSALNWVPFVGPELAHAADTIRGGNVAGGLAETAGTVATNEVVPATLRGAGMAARATAPLAMAGALRIPAQLARKYGRFKIAGQALEDRIVPGTAGASDKAQRFVNARMAQQDANLAQMDLGGPINTTQIADDAAAALQKRLARGPISQVRPSGQEPELITRFRNAHPQGLLPSQVAEGVRDWNDVGDAAWKGVPTGKVIDVDARAPMELANAGNATLEARHQGYRDQNRKIKVTKGVQLAAKGREDIPARGLENIATLFTGATALAQGSPKVAAATLAARALREPAVMASGAIGLNESGKLLQMLGSGLPANIQRALTLMLLQGK
jgi:hypothetical protein